MKKKEKINFIVENKAPIFDITSRNSILYL